MANLQNEIVAVILSKMNNSYSNFSGVVFHKQIDDDGTYLINAYFPILHDLNFDIARVDVSGTFTPEEFIKVFNINDIGGLDNIDPHSLWDLYPFGITEFICLVDDENYIFTMNEVDGSKQLFLDGKLMNSEGIEFYDPQSYLTYCLKKFHRHYRRRLAR